MANHETHSEFYAENQDYSKSIKEQIILRVFITNPLKRPIPLEREFQSLFHGAKALLPKEYVIFYPVKNKSIPKRITRLCKKFPVLKYSADTFAIREY